MHVAPGRRSGAATGMLRLLQACSPPAGTELLPLAADPREERRPRRLAKACAVVGEHEGLRVQLEPDLQQPVALHVRRRVAVVAVDAVAVRVVGPNRAWHQRCREDTAGCEVGSRSRA